MKHKFLKFFLATVTVALGAVTSVTRADVLVNVGGTNYNFSLFNGSYVDNMGYFNNTNMPWIGSFSAAQTFSLALGGSLGTPAPYFFYNSESSYDDAMGTDSYTIYAAQTNLGWNTSNILVRDGGASYNFATVSAVSAPEIDSSLIHQVGFLIGCLFLILGRRKENTEPMLAA